MRNLRSASYKGFLLCALLLALYAVAPAQSKDQVSSPAQTGAEAGKETGADQKHHAQPTVQPSLFPRTIYIDSPPDAEPIKKEIREKLLNWGGITVVNLPEQADVILHLVQSGKLNVLYGSGNRGSVVLENRQTGEELWSQSRGGGWSMSGYSNASVGRKLGDDLIQFLSKNKAHVGQKHE